MSHIVISVFFMWALVMQFAAVRRYIRGDSTGVDRISTFLCSIIFVAMDVAFILALLNLGVFS